MIKSMCRCMSIYPSLAENLTSGLNKNNSKDLNDIENFK